MTDDGAPSIRPAATVLLLRDAPDPAPGQLPLQVFLQRRATQMAFAGGVTAFPGGGVDPSDVPDVERWAGPDPAAWAALFGSSADFAGQAIAAAVRELFEETGVLLAGPPGGEPGAPTVQVPGWRRDLAAHTRSLSDILVTSGYVLRSDLLQPWARWVTPPGRSRRYDTVFFTAVLPKGQEADAHTTEAVEATWWHPAQALAACEDGEITLMPPTLVSMRDLTAHATAAEAFAASSGRDLAPIHPIDVDGASVRLPDGSVLRVEP